MIAGSTSSARLTPGHHHDQVARDDDGDHRAERADHGAQRQLVESGDIGERDDRDADRPERDRRRIGQQADAGGVERVEAEAGEHRARHGDRRAETGGALDEGAEREGDEHRLQPAIVGQPADRVLDDLELAGIDRQAVQHDRAEHDPRDRENPERGAVDRGDEGHLHRHAVGERARRAAPRPSALAAAIQAGLRLHAEHEEQDQDGNGGHGGRHSPDSRLRFIVVLPHSFLAARASGTASRCVHRPRTADEARAGPLRGDRPVYCIRARHLYLNGETQSSEREFGIRF